MKPVRVQIKRAAGWRMPENTVVVARPSKWGNQFRVSDERTAGESVGAFHTWLTVIACDAEMHYRKAILLFALPELRGKNLACWCPLDQPCHADVLLQLANDVEGDA